MQNSITNDRTAAESSTNAELNSSAPIMPNPMLAAVFKYLKEQRLEIHNSRMFDNVNYDKAVEKAKAFDLVIKHIKKQM